VPQTLEMKSRVLGPPRRLNEIQHRMSHQIASLNVEGSKHFADYSVGAKWQHCIDGPGRCLT